MIDITIVNIQVNVLVYNRAFVNGIGKYSWMCDMGLQKHSSLPSFQSAMK